MTLSTGVSTRAVTVGVLIGLIAAKVAFAVALYDPVRVWLHQDDYCRAVMSLDWGRQPYLHPYDLHWLPLQFYVYGMASWINAQDSQRTFVVVSQALAALTLLPVYGLSCTFFSRRAALLTCVLYVFASWQIVMSFSALAEPLYYFLALCGVHFFFRWWVGLGTMALAPCAFFLASAALTRYEGWLLLALVTSLGLIHVYRERLSREKAWIAAGLLLVPWVVPGLWMLENVRLHGVWLAFYGANRQALAAATHDYRPEIAGFLRRFLNDGLALRLSQAGPVLRVFWYPGAFLGLSIPLSGLLVVSFLKRRSWFGRRAGVLWVLAIGHLAVLTALYTSGSGPSFVMRIVLFHLFLLLPICGAALAIGLASSTRAGRAVAVAFLILFTVCESYHAWAVFAQRRHSDYRLTGDEYARLGDFLRARWGGISANVAVQCHDDGHFVRMHSREPWRVRNVRADGADSVFKAQDFEMLCVPIADLGPLRADRRVEDSFRSLHASQAIATVEFGNWRVLHVSRP